MLSIECFRKKTSCFSIHRLYIRLLGRRKCCLICASVWKNTRPCQLIANDCFLKYNKILCLYRINDIEKQKRLFGAVSRWQVGIVAVRANASYLSINRCYIPYKVCEGCCLFSVGKANGMAYFLEIAKWIQELYSLTKRLSERHLRGFVKLVNRNSENVVFSFIDVYADFNWFSQ